jgi:ATP-dependent DNA helicase RecQ
LVYEAKSYDRSTHPGNQTKAAELAERMAVLIQRHPSFRQAELLVPVPGSNSDKAYDLPAFLCQELSKRLGTPAPTDALRKTRASKPMKDFRTISEKIDNVQGAFLADAPQIRGKRVLLVDDIYQTGFSINEAGKAMQLAHAACVFGLVATKTMQDLGENLPW